MVPDPAGAVLVHLGSSDFLRRYKTYMTHAQEWRQQFQKLQSVDLRFDRQIVINPDSHVPTLSSAQGKPAATKSAVAKAAAAKAVKPARSVATSAKKSTHTLKPGPAIRHSEAD